jgi:hypothetical protein
VRSAEGAVAWMRDQHERRVTGWQGWCLRASRTAWGLPGGWNSANDWWAAAPAQHKHAWSAAPPLGAPVFFAGGRHGHIGLSDGRGGLWHTDGPTADRIGHTTINWPRDRWGFRNVGWASWLSGAVLPLGATGGGGGGTAPTEPDEGVEMDRSEVTRRAAQRIGPDWSWLTFDQEIRDNGNIHFRDGIFSLAGRRFDMVGGFIARSVDPNLANRISVQACVVNSSNGIGFQYPLISWNTGRGLVASHHASWAGFCSRDRRVRIRVRAMDGPAEITPTVTVTRWGG